MPINNSMPNEKNAQPVLEVKNLTVKFDKFVAVDDISFEVYPGEVLGILGENGAGKSTTLKVLGGILRPTSGDIYLKGLDLKKIADANKAKEITGYCPDVGGIIIGATPREHVKLLLTLHNKPELYDQGS
jgi:ABC-2 type transport system ATP-binding protein